MASIEFIKKRLSGSEDRLTKLEKKMERIRKAEASNWEVNPYYYNEYDIRRTEREINDEKKKIESYRADLASAVEKANSRNVEAIIQFLEGWKARVRAYYMVAMEEEKEMWEKIRAAYGTEEYKELGEYYNHNRYGEYEEREVPRYNFRRELVGYRKEKVKIADGKWEYAERYIEHHNFDEAVARLDRDLKDEADRKYDFIIERTNAIVGQITDASNLRVGSKGDLNGYVIGTKGAAKVQTIGAGGYNIQCFHFRTLINKMKQKGG